MPTALMYTDNLDRAGAAQARIKIAQKQCLAIWNPAAFIS